MITHFVAPVTHHSKYAVICVRIKLTHGEFCIVSLFVLHRETTCNGCRHGYSNRKLIDWDWAHRDWVTLNPLFVARLDKGSLLTAWKKTKSIQQIKRCVAVQMITKWPHKFQFFLFFLRLFYEPKWYNCMKLLKCLHFFDGVTNRIGTF